MDEIIDPPTPDEIAERCAEVQAEWSDKERRQRMRADWRPVRWHVPGIDITKFVSSISEGANAVSHQ